jgi:hypothetical protein
MGGLLGSGRRTRGPCKHGLTPGGADADSVGVGAVRSPLQCALVAPRGTVPAAARYSDLSSLAASSTWPISRERARASCVALVTSASAACTPEERSLRRSSRKF